VCFKVAAHATETMTLVSSSALDIARQHRGRNMQTPDMTQVVASPDHPPEVVFQRADHATQRPPSADECIRQAAEKLGQFAATRNKTTTGSSVGQRPSTGNDVTNDSRRRIGESPHPTQNGRSGTSQTVTTPGTNDAQVKLHVTKNFNLEVSHISLKKNSSPDLKVELKVEI